MNIYQICYFVFAAIFIGIFIYEKVYNRPIFGKLIQGKPILEALKLLVKACAGVLPSSYFDKAAIILEACVNATVEAEELWKAGDIEKSARSEYCQLVIARMLKEAGVEVDEQVQQIITGCIAIVCMLMPHSGIAEEVKED